MLSLILLKQRAGVLTPEDLKELNQYADPDDPVTRIASLQARSAN
jgi:hypothetical protein